MATVHVPLDRIDENPYQTRRTYDEEHIAQLAGDIDQNELMQVPAGRIVDPSTGVPIPTEWNSNIGRVQLAFGHNRLRAFRQLGRETMPVRLRNLTDEQMADQAWGENHQRKDLSPVEEALAIQDRLDAFDYSKTELAERMGIGRSTLSNKLRLLRLPEEVLDYVRAGALSERQATALVPMFNLGAEEQDVVDGWDVQHYYRPEHILQNALDGYTSGEVRSVVSSAKERIENELATAAATPSQAELEERLEELRTRHRQADPPHPSAGTVYDADDGDLADAAREYQRVADAAGELLRKALEHGNAKIGGQARKLQRRAANTASDLSARVSAGGEFEDMTATELSDELLDEFGINLPPNHSREKLLDALTDAWGQRTKEQPDDAEALKEHVELAEEQASAERSKLGVSGLHSALGEIKTTLRSIDRRDTWVREQLGEEGGANTAPVISKYQSECTSLHNLKRRATVAQKTLKSRLKAFDGQPAGGDGQAAKPDVHEVAFNWPRPQLPAEWRRIGTLTQDGLSDVHRRFKHEQWDRYGTRWLASQNKPVHFEHVQEQIRFHADLEAVQRLDEGQVRELHDWINEQLDGKSCYRTNPVGRAGMVLRSVRDAEKLGVMREAALDRLRLAETRRAGAFCYHLFYEDKTDMEAAVRPSAGDGEATGAVPTLRDPDTADMFTGQAG